MINHETLALWEIPLLRKAGFKNIFTPQGFPENPSFTSGGVVELNTESFTLTKEETDLLSQQNWYQNIDATASGIINKNFSIAFTTSDPTQVLTILNAFDGLIVVRLFGLDGKRTYSELYNFYFTPYETQLLKNNLHRIVFAIGYRELLENEESWLTERCVFLPIGLPERLHSSWNGTSENVIAVVPRIEPRSYYEKNLIDHKKMTPKKNLIVGGRQHLKFSDKRILGSLHRREFDQFLESSRCMIYASKEARHVHYHPLEAMQIGLPVVYFKNSLLARIVGGDNAGAVQSYRQAKKIVRRMIKNIDLARQIGATQRELVSAVEGITLESVFLEGCKEITKRWSERISQVRTEIILCENELNCTNCAPYKNQQSDTLKFANINELSDFFGKSEPQESFYIDSRTLAIGRVKGLSHYSRTFNVDTTYLDMLWVNGKNFEIILCDQIFPHVILTSSKVTRKLKRDTCEEFSRYAKKNVVELLRYSLDSIDEVLVPDSKSKEFVTAFVPVDSIRVRTERTE